MKSIVKEVLTDVKHWIGWGITIAGIIGFLYLVDINLLNNPLRYILPLAIVIIGIDVLKHKFKLQ